MNDEKGGRWVVVVSNWGAGLGGIVPERTQGVSIDTVPLEVNYLIICLLFLFPVRGSFNGIIHRTAAAATEEALALYKDGYNESSSESSFINVCRFHECPSTTYSFPSCPPPIRSSSWEEVRGLIWAHPWIVKAALIGSSVLYAWLLSSWYRQGIWATHQQHLGARPIFMSAPTG